MPDLSVADNISITSPPRRFGLIDARAQRRRAEALLAEIGCEDVNPLMRVRDLPLSRRQMVEIAKALGQKPQLLILDEAASALTSADVEKVYAMLAKLKSEGVAILYISHRMHEVEALADRASVFRNGRHVRDLRQGRALDCRYRSVDDRARHRHPISGKACARAGEARVGTREPVLGETTDRISLTVSAPARSSASAASMDRADIAAACLVRRAARRHRTYHRRGPRGAPRSPAAAKSPAVGIALVPEDRKTKD